MIARAALVVFLLPATGCATITTGTHETLSIDSNPSNAAVSLQCDRAEPQHAVTPATLSVARKAGACTLAVEKDGFETRKLVLEQGINGRYWANFAFSPLVPTGVYFIITDPITSSDRAAGAAMITVAAAAFLTDFVTGAVHEHTIDGLTARRIEVELKRKQ